jgi:hypothetical protein
MEKPYGKRETNVNKVKEDALLAWFKKHPKITWIIAIGMVIMFLFAIKDDLSNGFGNGLGMIFSLLLVGFWPILIFCAFVYLGMRLMKTWNKLDKKLDKELDKESDKKLDQ